MLVAFSHISWLEAEAFHIIRKDLAEFSKAVMVFFGKSLCHTRISRAASLFLRNGYFHCCISMRHRNSSWFSTGETIFLRNRGFSLIIHVNEDVRAAGINRLSFKERYSMVRRGGG